MVFRIKIFIIICLFSYSCKITEQNKKDISDYKKIAFCTCLNLNYKSIDSSFYNKYNDISKSQLFMNSKLTPFLADKIEVFTIENTSLYYKLESHTTDEIGGGSNFIMLSCLKFYESDTLDKFIKNTIK